MTATREQSYQMRLEYFQLDGTSVLEVALGEQDFARAVEAAFFEGLRRGRYTEYAPPFADVRIEPSFARRSGSPLAKGFSVVMPADDGEEHRVDFSVDFLKSHAQRILVDRVLTGEVEAGTIQFRLAAYLDEPKPAVMGGMTFEPDEPCVP